ncbi:uncharacterized protein LOC125837442 [Solanum verrucosum]|uniref:uncharacterized protein LOC125837442 n=1 Tax=Solanum verrucosum TaxID=315347 RepID=UPI0020D11B00|nr:uncharacterized protein LOC125837442 [Solanum verrucosum]
MIIVADLLDWQIKLLLEVLRRHIKAIGWTIADIVRISPGICTHKIQLDSDCKPSVEHQRRLNPLMQEKGIVLGHKVSQKGLEVDKAKIEVIEKFPPPISVKCVCCFLGHAGFYRRFIKDFSKIASPLCKILEKKVKFHFDDACMVFTVTLNQPLWYADCANYVVYGLMPDELNFYQQKRLLFDVKKYFWDEPYLFREYTDHIIRRCVPKKEAIEILHACHASPVGSHHGGVYVQLLKFYEVCTTVRLSTKILMSLLRSAVNVRNKVVAHPKNEGKTVVHYLKCYIFARLVTSQAIISDGGSHFYNQCFSAALSMYGVKHKVATPYHPQTSGQVEVSIGKSKASWPRQ